MSWFSKLKKTLLNKNAEESDPDSKQAVSSSADKSNMNGAKKTAAQNPANKKKTSKGKRKTLPKDFQELLEKGDFDALKAVFEKCDVNAYGGYSKQTALAFNECPNELVRWLVEQGADINAGDTYGETPLHSRAGNWQGHLEILIELGADVNHRTDKQDTPLHRAARSANNRTAKVLIEHGADVNAVNGSGLTPLALALKQCHNAKIEEMTDFADLLLAAGAKKTPEMKRFVTTIGTNFEFYRNGFNPDSVEASSKALNKLYATFDVEPVPRREMHDGKSPIVAKSKTWEERHQELWELLIPSSGSAQTVQGEVVRISGKIHRELYGNGGINWDAEYKQMADAFLAHISAGKPLADPLLTEAKAIIAEVKKKDGDTERMMELAVQWVALNPKPIKLPKPDYDR